MESLRVTRNIFTSRIPSEKKWIMNPTWSTSKSLAVCLVAPNRCGISWTPKAWRNDKCWSLPTANDQLQLNFGGQRQSPSKISWQLLVEKCYPTRHISLTWFPLSYCLFSLMGHVLTDQDFKNYEEVEKDLKEQNIFWSGVHKLPGRWEKCVAAYRKKIWIKIFLLFLPISVSF